MKDIRRPPRRGKEPFVDSYSSPVRRPFVCLVGGTIA